MISFEEWLAINEAAIRRRQYNCETGHAEGGEHWWDTRVDLECFTCGRRPGQAKESLQTWQIGCDCEDMDDYPPCDCNARVLYEKAVAALEPQSDQLG